MSDPALRGRESQLSVLRGRLDALVSGQGGVAVIHGAAGMGKTRLIRDLVALGDQRGVVVRYGRCDVLARSVPLGTLLAALLDGSDLDPEPLRSVSHQPFWLIRAMQDALKRATADGPVLIALDDLQWADPDTLSALIALTESSSGYRVLWLITVRAGSTTPLVAAALERLAANGAIRVEIGPLDLPAVTDITRDLLTAEPGRGLPAAVAGAEAQPLFLVELLRGLREDGSIAVAGGVAELTTVSLPRRVRVLVDGQLRQLTESARHTVQLGAALGRRFTGAELAELAERTPAAMLTTIEEAISAGLFVAAGDDLGFRHELVREAVEASVPATVFSALRRDAIGAPPAEAPAMAARRGRRASRPGRAERDLLLVPRALRAMERLEWRHSLELIGDAVAVVHAQGPGAPHLWRADVWQAHLYLACARPSDALALADSGLAAAQHQGLSGLAPAWSSVRARALLDVGRLADARIAAEDLLAVSADAGHLHDVALYVIGCIGLHTGGPADIERTRAAAERLRTAAQPSTRRLGASLTARLDGVLDPLGELVDAPLLAVTTPWSYSDAVWQVRLLLAAGEADAAQTVAARLTGIAVDRPDFPYLRASAAHARALVHDDAALAAEAAAGHSDDPRLLVRAAAIEDAGRLLPSTARDQAIARLAEALSLYSTAGADLDVARVRALLRQRGVRRTVGSSVTSWPELTDAESTVAQFAAAGSTNQAIAARMHISPHTVNSHLRHIYDKLGVRSRVELTRLVTERAHRAP
ncbi:ATP-binding protein [Cryptosporangium arvum]|uniref:Transcriptional regulator, luxR family n=1 Tax=Cryptosporangium arvum DSM 44712 TaxID=927661 RepID=A0A010YPI0_9ACTN|nr:AAA family ATPase [Cryptosporangium arvum]EXG82100.1 transcriptional regulator, luxR family [Cryptosporangium arvum DSM 44712]